jgi:hypothetical protein
MWRYDYRASDYDQVTEKRTGVTADALAECFHRLFGGCHLSNRDERGIV